jgi:acetyl-CoA carboxylase biotin carboxylase subunit
MGKREIKKLLIANRGEIAIRIMRSAKELGIPTVAVYSEADKNSLHLSFADEAICIGPPPASESYLNTYRIIAATIASGANAIHPGYGFLAENSNFARLCEEHGIIFIGPSFKVIKAMGDKLEARKIARRCGIPIIPGSLYPINSSLEAKNIIKRCKGYPVVIKAALGGGGKGIRFVNSPEELEQTLTIAQREAQAAFNSSLVYIEKALDRPRHIEVQVIGDNYGRVVCLGDRECSIQHKYQKLIEEAPAWGISHKLREKLHKAAVKLARYIKYSGVGTVEFLVDRKKNFYFLEMNTRIQVEHPVTEAITGIDIVKEGIRIASGLPLSIRQHEVKFYGAAIECRINSGDKDLTPISDKVSLLHLPSGYSIRVDTHLYQNYEVPPYYDGLLAKFITWGRDREEAIVRMRRALDEFICNPLKTNVELHKTILSTDKFLKGELSTQFLSECGCV